VTVAGRRAPGPRGSLLFGSAREIQRDPLRAYAGFARDFGEVVRIRFVLWPTYLLFHPDHVRHVLQEKHTNYGKDLYTYNMLRPVVGNGLITNDGSSWLRQRRLVQPAFHRQRLGSLAGVVTEQTLAMLERWRSVDVSPLDVSAEMGNLALQIAALALFGVDLSAEAGQIGDVVKDVNELLTDYVHSPLPPLFVPTRRNLRLRAARRRLHSFVLEIIARRRAEEADPGDVLSLLLRARDEETGEGMDDEQLRDEVVTLLIAGHETTASALTWAWYLLGRHPEAERRLREELEAALRGSLPGMEQLPRLSYTRMVLEETMRLYPPAWSFGRKALVDDDIGGFHIPAGSIVWVSPYVTHRHPAFWQRPEEFDPERFTPEKSASRPRFAYFPFAGGPRMCVGRDFAMLVSTLVLATVAQRYRLDLVPGHRVEPEALLTLSVRGGLRMVARPVD
jgi:cytochrome P450